MRIRLDHGPDGGPCLFAAPRRRIVAHAPHEVAPALAALDAARAEGFWLAGHIAYEAGYALEPRLAPLMPAPGGPLLSFGAYDAPASAPELAGGAATLGPGRPAWDAARYARAFERLHALICAGDLYQANLTFPIRMDATGTPAALYAALAAIQPVRFGALVEDPEAPHAILSRSPELFFRTDADGMIETRPMKGTQPRGADAAEDAANRAFLREDEKTRAENLMIVDLLRNDLSRVCQPGTVRVPDLFAVESYATVHQMTSRITGQLQPATPLSAILAALFPCGSITGAPKVRAMEVIADLEDTPRGPYCGTIGWAAPDGRAEFNVAIRTLLMTDGAVTLNVGGGVVYDSTAASEYEEALWKARFARTPDVA